MGANKEQLNVIEQTEGIYIVDAGAGTGKTYTITQRYNNILNKKKISPKDILLVTFTKNAAINMKEKVISKADPKLTTQLLDAPILNFDSFCSKIVSKNGLNAPAILGIKDNLSNYKLISQSVIQRRIFNKFFNKFLESNEDKYKELLVTLPNSTQIQSLIEQLLSKGVFPTKTGWFLDGQDKLKGNFKQYLYLFNELNQPIEGKTKMKQSKLLAKFKSFDKEYINYPQNFEIEQQLDPKLAEISFNDDRENLLEFTHSIYIEYIEYMIKENLMTFSLVAMFAFLILYDDLNVRKNNSFKYVMVDEFQDTNEMQFMLILLLMKESNLCVVGDWKQGIYGFRNATISNITNFQNKIEEYKKVLNKDKERVNIDITNIIPLSFKTNYRSSQKILSFSEESLIVSGNKNEVLDIENIQNSIVQLESNFDYNECSNIEFYKTKNRESEIDYILQKIQELVQNKTIKVYNQETQEYETRKVEYKDIAILSRTRTFGLDIQKRALEFNIPTIYDGGIELFEEEPAIILLAWLKFLLYKNKKDAWIVILEKENYSYAQIKHILISREYPQDILEFREHLLKNKKIINYVIDEIFKKYHFNSPISNAMLNILENLFHSTLMSISDLILFIEENIENGETYSIELPSTSNSIKIQTIHGSKGLEYKIVFVVNCNLSSFPSTQSNTSTLTFHETSGIRSKKLFLPQYNYIFDNWKTDLVNIGLFSDMDEERRLLYVAITRAMYDVYFTSNKPSEFFNQLAKDNFTEIEETNIKTNNIELEMQSTDIKIQTEIKEPEKILSVHNLMKFKKGQKGRGKEFGNIIHKLAFRYIKKLPITGIGDDCRVDFENVKNFIDTKLRNGKLMPEIDCSLPIDGTLIRGIIDLVVEFEDRIEIIDWKTDLVKDNIEEYSKQLSIYHCVLKEIYPDKEIVCKIFWTNTGEVEEVKPIMLEEVIK